MNDGEPPSNLDGARVVTFAILESAGRTRGLAICQYPDDNGWHLFQCDARWSILSDSFHASEGDAKQQAEADFEGVGALWRHAA